jgi:hypothetical protein
MGCCSPHYRKTVNEQEEKINQKGKDTLPLALKLGLALVFIGGIVLAFLVN